MGEFFLHVTHGVVAKVTHQSTAKTWQLGGGVERRDLELRQIFFDGIQRISHRLLPCFFAACELRALVAAHFETRFRGQANERVTPEAFTTNHGFEQIGIGLVGELEINRQRGVEIGEGLKQQGNAVVAGLRQPVEFGFSHDALHTKTVYSGPRANAARQQAKMNL